MNELNFFLNSMQEFLETIQKKDSEIESLKEKLEIEAATHSDMEKQLTQEALDLEERLQDLQHEYDQLKHSCEQLQQENQNLKTKTLREESNFHNEQQLNEIIKELEETKKELEMTRNCVVSLQEENNKLRSENKKFETSRVGRSIKCEIMKLISLRYCSTNELFLFLDQNMRE
jgi:chromosome segregation ATPase